MKLINVFKDHLLDVLLKIQKSIKHLLYLFHAYTAYRDTSVNRGSHFHKNNVACHIFFKCAAFLVPAYTGQTILSEIIEYIENPLPNNIHYLILSK